MQPVYDEHAKVYDSKHQEAVSASGYDVAHFYEYKIKEIRRVTQRRGGSEPGAILDFGCGVGNVDPYIRKYYPDSRIYGIDISQESIKLAKQKHEDMNISYAAYDMNSDDTFPFDVKFDMIFVSCVFQHVPRGDHLKMMKMLSSLLGDGGMLFIFEHNPVNPVSRSVFRNWDMKIDENAYFVYSGYLKKIVLQAGGLDIIKRNFTVFFPKILSALIPLEKYMTWIPLGAQYYVMAAKNG